MRPDVDSALVERFWDKVDRAGPEGCWVWTACTVRGYGSFQVGNTGRRAHRFAYELLVGRIPDGLVLDHLCRNKSCVNPAHLEPVTQRENVLRGVGPSARQAAQTHCKRGHPLAGDNLYTSPSGRRICITCRRALRRMKRRRAREAREAHDA